ncbi:phosphopyruvate hydratase [Jongsikchunia kroppenstedtii]|uniref:phosphopyruvate hydratase n=1 Tax=Jongsikchunia kroppenstedtii TaxID=1121721 RepID=UPI00036B37EA|nr:phosphopyruvate hydratase [Jongsikchunia kroppenstedtii]
MTLVISQLHAQETLDSRGNPTVAVVLYAESGLTVAAGVPAGASTGSREAVEIRDGDPDRYHGAGVLGAVRNVAGEIADSLVGVPFSSLDEVDQRLLDLDGSGNKSRLGANAVAGVSMAAAKAFAVEQKEPLWLSLAGAHVVPRLPVPHFNVINGGRHAGNGLPFQEFMIAPLGAPSVADAVRAGAEVYAALRGVLAERGFSTGLGDEGGFAPTFSRPEEALAELVKAIGSAGYKPSRDEVAIAIDPAASEFYADGRYQIGDQSFTSSDMIEMYSTMLDDFPIWSIEDGLAESDDAGWRAMTDQLGDRVQLVGDDNFVTNPAIIADAVVDGIANAALIKVNQVGTVTETLMALDVCRRSNYGAMISHRSGETTDSFIADLAVGAGTGQIKAGAPARGERIAKYNRLISIEQANPALAYGLPESQRRP